MFHPFTSTFRRQTDEGKAGFCLADCLRILTDAPPLDKLSHGERVQVHQDYIEDLKEWERYDVCLLVDDQWDGVILSRESDEIFGRISEVSER